MVIRIATLICISIIGSYGNPTSINQDRNGNIFLVLNQNKYVAGDIVRFKAYFLTENNKPISGSFRAIATLADTLGRAIDQINFIITNGIGYNQILLQQNHAPGLYNFSVTLDGIEANEKVNTHNQAIIVVEPNLTIHKRTDDTSISSSIKIVVDSIFKKRDSVSLSIEINGALQKISSSGEFSVNVFSLEHLSLSKPTWLKSNIDRDTLTDLMNKEPFSEFNSRIRQAQIKFNSGLPLPDSTIVYFYLQKSHWRYQTVALKNGIVNLIIPDLLEEDEFYYLAKIKNQITDDLMATWLSKESHPANRKDYSIVYKDDTYALFRQKTDMINSAFNYYINLNDNSTINNNQFPDLITTPTIEVFLDKYISFPTMTDCIKSIIPAMYYRKSKGKEWVRLKLLPLNKNVLPKTPTGDPIFIIDGVATKNTQLFLSLAPKEVISIKIVNEPHKLNQFGIFGENGIVIVKTKSGNKAESKNALSRKATHISKYKQFELPNHSNRPTVPIFSSILYWNPSVKTDEFGKAKILFKTADVTGPYAVEVIGFIENQPFWTYAKFRVD